MSYEIYSVAPDILHTGILPSTQQIFNYLMTELGYQDRFKGRVSYEAYGVTKATASDEHNNPTLAEDSANIKISYSLQDNSLQWSAIGSGTEYQRLINTTGMHTDKKALFVDKVNKILLHHYEHPLAVAMECELEFMDIVSATECMQRLKSYTSANLFEYNLDYSYFLPIKIYGVIYTLFKQAGNAPESFFTYLAEHSNGAICRMSNRHDNADKGIVARCLKSRLVASLELNQDIPEPIGDTKSPIGFRVTVTINTQFSVPHLLALTYPLIVNNQQIPRELIPVKVRKVDETLDANYPYHSIDAFKDAVFKRTKSPVVRTPWYDNWIPLNLRKGYNPVLIGVVTLDDTDNPEGVTVVNLPEAYGEYISNDIFNLYRRCGNTALGFYNLLSVTVYQDDILIDPATLTLDDNLNLTIPNRDVTKSYRVVLSYNPVDYSKNDVLRIINTDIIARRNKAKTREVITDKAGGSVPTLTGVEKLQQIIEWQELHAPYVGGVGVEEISNEFIISVVKEIIPVIPTEPSEIPEVGEDTPVVPDENAEHFIEINASMGSAFNLFGSEADIPVIPTEPSNIVSSPEDITVGTYGELSFKGILTSAFLVLAEAKKIVRVPDVPIVVPPIEEGGTDNTEWTLSSFNITSVTTDKIIVPTVPSVIPTSNTSIDNVNENVKTVFNIKATKSVIPIIPTEPTNVQDVGEVISVNNETLELGNKTITSFNINTVSKPYRINECGEEIYVGPFTITTEKSSIPSDSVEPENSTVSELVVYQRYDIIAEVNEEVRLTFGITAEYHPEDYPLEWDREVEEQSTLVDFKHGGSYAPIPTDSIDGGTTEIGYELLKKEDIVDDFNSSNEATNVISNWKTTVNTGPIPSKLLESVTEIGLTLISEYDWVEELAEQCTTTLKINSVTTSQIGGTPIELAEGVYELLVRADLVENLEPELTQEFDIDVVWWYIKEQEEDPLVQTFTITGSKEVGYYAENPPQESTGTWFSFGTSIEYLGPVFAELVQDNTRIVNGASVAGSIASNILVPTPGVYSTANLYNPKLSTPISSLIELFDTTDFKITFAMTSFAYNTAVTAFVSNGINISSTWWRTPLWAVFRGVQKFAFGWGSYLNYGTSTTTVLNTIYTHEKRGTKFYLNNTLKWSMTDPSHYIDTKLAGLYTPLMPTGTAICYFRCYGATFWDSASRTNCIANILPVPAGDTTYDTIPAPAVGFYDTINKRYLYSGTAGLQFQGTMPTS